VRKGNRVIEDQVEYKALILIAAKPDRMRDSLYTLLKTMTGLDIVGPADDSSSALRMVSVYSPALVLLDTNMPGEDVFTVLKRIKADGSQSRCLVLVNNILQEQQVRSAGADAALIKGYSAAELFEIIERMLSQDAGQLASTSKGV
jgi:DNA-binding NarL/FixJ family response regulator